MKNEECVPRQILLWLYSTTYNCVSYINDQINSISIYYKIQNASCQSSEDERGTTTKTLGKKK